MQNYYVLKKHFKIYNKFCNVFNIHESNCYNMNEIEFCIKCSVSHIMIIIKHIYKLMLIDADNCDYFITVKCINAAKYILSSFFIIINIYILIK